jgi:flagellar basal body-associated protein FliL
MSSANPTPKTNEFKPDSKKTWQLIVLAFVTYLLFIATSGVSTWIAFKSNGFNSTSQANGSKAGALLFLILSILLPIFYGVFAYLKDYDTQAPIQKYKNISRDAILIIIMISFVLLITMSSFGVWMTNANHNWNSTQQEHGVQIYFIIVLVLSIMLPFLYGLFYYRKEICERLNKAGDIKF